MQTENQNQGERHESDFSKRKSHMKTKNETWYDISGSSKNQKSFDVVTVLANTTSHQAKTHALNGIESENHYIS